MLALFCATKTYPGPPPKRSECRAWASESLAWASEGLAWASESLAWVSESRAWASEGLAWVSESRAWASEGLAWVSEIRAWAGVQDSSPAEILRIVARALRLLYGGFRFCHLYLCGRNVCIGGRRVL
jgi:hypothetical protein